MGVSGPRRTSTDLSQSSQTEFYDIPLLVESETTWRDDPRWKPLMQSPCPLIPDPSPTNSFNSDPDNLELADAYGSCMRRRRNANYHPRPPIWNIQPVANYQRDFYGNTSYDTEDSTYQSNTIPDEMYMLKDDPFVDRPYFWDTLPSVLTLSHHNQLFVDAMVAEWQREPLIIRANFNSNRDSKSTP